MLKQVGFGIDRVLAPDLRPPADIQGITSCVSAIYDDTVVFSRESGNGGDDVRRIRDVFSSHLVEPSPEKDQEFVFKGLACGVEFADGMTLRPNIAKLSLVLNDILQMLENAVCSPAQLAAVLGSLQWFDLLCRPEFSCFSRCYSVTRLAPDETVSQISVVVGRELLMSIRLCPAWLVDLTTTPSETVFATDASTFLWFWSQLLPIPNRRCRTTFGAG